MFLIGTTEVKSRGNREEMKLKQPMAEKVIELKKKKTFSNLKIH